MVKVRGVSLCGESPSIFIWGTYFGLYPTQPIFNHGKEFFQLNEWVNEFLVIVYASGGEISARKC